MTEDRECCRHSKATLRRSVQELDSKIVAACNDLLRLRSYTPRMVVDNSNESARLKRVCEQREALLKKRLREAISSKLLCTYREVCEQSLAEQGRSIPVAVTSRQVQLLHHIHTMTIFDNQRDLLDKHKSQEYVALENEVNKIQQEQSMNENRILRDIIELEDQIANLEKQLNDCQLLTTKSRVPLLRKTKECVLSSRTLETTLSDSLSLGDDEYLTEFVPKLDLSPTMSAPGRPKGLIKMSSQEKARLTTAQNI